MKNEIYHVIYWCANTRQWEATCEWPDIEKARACAEDLKTKDWVDSSRVRIVKVVI